MRRPARYAIAALILGLSGCASLPDGAQDRGVGEIFDPDGPIHAVDARADFRRVYCQINESRGASMPDYRGCDDALRQVPPKPRPAREIEPAGTAAARFTVLVVPGLGYDCFTGLIGNVESLEDAAAFLGHRIVIVPVEGLGDIAENASIIRNSIAESAARLDDTEIILIGYSKGTNDLLAALADNPEVAERVSAVVGVSSAVGGSYLAEKFDLWALDWLAHLPGSDCQPPGEHILAELHPEARHDWLAQHTLPASVRYFSLVTYPDADRVSAALKPAFRNLAEIDTRNDGQVIVTDQVIPGSQVLGFANADHWAIALPIARSSPVIGSTAVNRNDFPREVLLQAILEYVGIELARR